MTACWSFCLRLTVSLSVLKVSGVKEVADYVSKLRRVGKGLGVYQFDAVSQSLKLASLIASSLGCN